MPPDRDERYEESEESEYHFSDEEGGDYVDADIPKESSASVVQASNTAGIGRGLSPSKRMLISLMVFLVLVYVVYKMVAPSSQVPAVDMTAATVLPVTATHKPSSMQATQPSVALPVVSPPPMTPSQQASAVTAPPTTMPLPSTPMGQPLATTQPPPVIMTSPQQVSAVTAPLQQMMPPQGGSMETGMPSIIPVQSAISSTMSPASASSQSLTDRQMAAMQMESLKLMGQLQSDYVQKLNDFSTQNKALQDQVQTLNSRISTLETQLNQLVQALTHQNNQGSEAPPPIPVESSSAGQKISYNVQAIIPGRAWLRSDNGETLTVAEGDVIKNIGRVTKIDPYDGVVEINTGNKVVSLSYGTGA